MSKKTGSNDARLNVKNPNNSAYVADRGNQIAQGHPNAPPPPPANPPGSTSGNGAKQ